MVREVVQSRWPEAQSARAAGADRACAESAGEFRGWQCGARHSQECWAVWGQVPPPVRAGPLE
eukprot:697905-Pyramimonas_sp.AAC.1